ncbi:MAG TPA: hypothetical protein PK253_19050 [Spirochaetota bacterium]|nr:hypothetical protein [Spirochaetota bacterium]
MKTIHATGTLYIAPLLVIFSLFFNSSLSGDPAQSTSGNADNTIRFIIFDFTPRSSSIDSSTISRVFREEFKRRNRFSVLDIDEINKETARKDTELSPAGTRNRAVSIGKSVHAHKIIIGEIVTIEQKERLTVDVIDIKTGTTDFSMQHDEDPMTTGTTAMFANSVADRVLGIEPETKKSARKDAAGISFGMLSPWREIGPYLNTMLLTKAHYEYPTGIYKNTALDFSIGYARTSTKSSIAGDLTMRFVPLTVSLAARFPVFSTSWLPVPVLYGGCGITYLSLSGTAGNQSISRQGVDITALAGMGLSFSLTDTLYFQLQTMLYYLYEDIEVTYYYYGVMLQYRL